MDERMKQLIINEVQQDIFAIVKANGKKAVRKALADIAKDAVDALEGLEREDGTDQ